LGGGLGFAGVQIPSWIGSLFDLKKAAESQDYCDEVLGVVHGAGLEVTELSTHLQGQLVACASGVQRLFADFAPAELKGDAKGRQAWAVEQLLWAAKASQRMGLTSHARFPERWPGRSFIRGRSGRRGWSMKHLRELGRRWLPILNAFDEAGVDACYELHPGEDLHDGVTFERFLERSGRAQASEYSLRPESHDLAADGLSWISRYLP
jgi:sugar phosphate isomerase/epimerase